MFQTNIAIRNSRNYEIPCCFDHFALSRHFDKNQTLKELDQKIKYELNKKRLLQVSCTILASTGQQASSLPQEAIIPTESPRRKP